MKDPVFLDSFNTQKMIFAKVNIVVLLCVFMLNLP